MPRRTPRQRQRRPALTDIEFNNANIGRLATELLPLIDNEEKNNLDLDRHARFELIKLRVLVANTKSMADKQEVPRQNWQQTTETLEAFISNFSRHNN